MQITWLSYFGSENQGFPLHSWFVTCWLWRHIPIVPSLAVPSSCVVTQTPIGTNSGTRRRKRKFPLLFVNCDCGRIEIYHLYGLRCRGWYYNPEQHSLCRPSRGRLRPRDGRHISWSIHITTHSSQLNLFYLIKLLYSYNAQCYLIPIGGIFASDLTFLYAQWKVFFIIDRIKQNGPEFAFSVWMRATVLLNSLFNQA